jgi:molybdopterin molybdotransferase
MVQPRSGLCLVERATGWIDAATRRLEPEEIATFEAAGRVVAEDVHARHPVPHDNCAALDGFAVWAEETLGAGPYNPLVLPAHYVEAGAGLPHGADAVVPLDHVEHEEAGLVALVEAVAAGDNVTRRGAVVEAGALLLRAGTPLGPSGLGLCASAGVARLPVVRQPRVRVVIAGSVPAGSAADSDGPMVGAAVERDGGVVAAASLDQAFAEGADIVLVVGGTGPGRRDGAAAALAAAGEVAIHGVALQPGETAGFGHTRSGTPVLLLPGAPAACLWAYEFFAGRAIRRLGGRAAELPYRRSRRKTARKIVSAIGMTEICAVRCRPDESIEPLASFAETGLAAAVAAAGFVIIPETSEGYPAGTSLDAYLYEVSAEVAQ